MDDAGNAVNYSVPVPQRHYDDRWVIWVDEREKGIRHAHTECMHTHSRTRTFCYPPRSAAGWNTGAEDAAAQQQPYVPQPPAYPPPQRRAQVSSVN